MLSNISLFGWLENIPLWAGLSYPIKGALLRALKGGLSVTVGILLAAALQGVLFPQGLNPLVILAVTSILQAVDKFLREVQIEKDTAENDAGISLNDSIQVPIDALEAYKKANPDAEPVVTDVNTDATVVTPSNDPSEPAVNTDATTVTVDTETLDPTPEPEDVPTDSPVEDVPVDRPPDDEPLKFDDPIDDRI